MVAALTLAACLRAPNVRAPSAGARGNDRASDYDDLSADLRQDPAMAALLEEAARRRIQVLVAIPDEASRVLTRRAFRGDSEYFYPASAIKLCAAVAALEKLDELRAHRADVDVETPLRITFAGDRARSIDTTLRDEIERALVLSDNDAFNRLFDFVGEGELTARLRGFGLESARVVHHLGDPADSGAPAFELRGSGKPLPVGQRVAADESPARSALVGSAHVAADGRIVDEPLDFGAKNRITLRDLQDLLIAVVRPDINDGPRPSWSSVDREKLVGILGRLPSELPGRPPRALDDQHKPLLAAVSTALPGHAIRVFGKGGRAYGFTVENSYVVDDTTNRGVFVAATIYANDNETINDDRYEYATVADPFIGHLGRVIARTLLR